MEHLSFVIMKKLVLLLLCLVPIFSYGQEEKIPLKKAGKIQKDKPVKNPIKSQVVDTIVFKGVNKILIENDKSVNQNLFLLQSAFLKRGYKATIDRKNFIVSTTDSLIEGGSVVYVFNGLVKENSIALSGKYNVHVVTSIVGAGTHIYNYEVSYTGAEKATAKKLFAVLTAVARDLNGKLTYMKEIKRKNGAIF
jgi:hypothetical protein